MCFGDGGAKEALLQSQREAAMLQRRIEQEAKAKEERIRAGQTTIDNAFAQFGDDYYNNYAQSYVDAQNPDIEYQYDRSLDKAKATMAKRGVGNSTIAGNLYGDLYGDYLGGKETAASEAQTKSKQLRSTIEDAKTGLYSLNQESADPETMATKAMASATALTPTSATSNVGDLFSSTLSPFLSYVKASSYSPYSKGTGSWFSASGSGSGKVSNF
jgi:hypothetical protein